MAEEIDDEERPHLSELDKRAAIGLHYGHPLILEGNRPMTSNMISIGMMNCRPAKPITTNQPLSDFINSKAAKEHGVIYIAFGSLIKPDLVRWCKFNHQLYGMLCQGIFHEICSDYQEWNGRSRTLDSGWIDFHFSLEWTIFIG